MTLDGGGPNWVARGWGRHVCRGEGWYVVAERDFCRGYSSWLWFWVQVEPRLTFLSCSWYQQADSRV